MDLDVWGAPILVVLLATISGLYIVLSDKKEDTLKDATNNDLAVKKGQIMEAIHELDADAAKMDKDSYNQQREELVAQAAEVLRLLDDEEAREKWKKSPNNSVINRKQLISYAAIFIAFFAVLAGLLYAYSVDRTEGGTITGGDMSGVGQQKTILKEFHSRYTNSMTALNKNSSDANALAVLIYDVAAMYPVIRRPPPGVTGEEYNEQISKSMREFSQLDVTGNADALMVKGVMYHLRRNSSQGLFFINLALKIEPDHPQALLWRAEIQLAQEQNEQALADARRAEGKLSLIVDKDRLETLIDRLDVPPPVISGRIQIPEQYSAPKNGVIFVTVRRTDTRVGPPVAVRKYRLSSFPLQFGVGLSNMMMGGKWPSEVWIQAHIDADGNPSTKGDSYWKTEMIGPIAGEKQDLVMTLQPKDGVGTKKSTVNAATEDQGLLLQRQQVKQLANEALAKNPNDLQALNDLIYDHLLANELSEAKDKIARARDISQDDPDLLTNSGIYLFFTSMKGEKNEVFKALSTFKVVLDSHPDHPRALLWRAVILMNYGATDKALADINKAKGKLTLVQELALVDKMLASIPANEPVLEGKLHLPDDAGTPDSGTIFVIARRTKEAKGPPLAVRKYQLSSFPRAFTLGPRDMMLGGDWPDEVWLEARLDADSNPTTKSDADWVSATIGPLKGAQSNLKLVLQP